MWSLMHRRCVVVNNSVLKEEKKAKTKFKSATVIMDFEKAAINAFIENIPGVLSKSCFFEGWTIKDFFGK